MGCYRSRSGSLASEARDWHAQRQDPLQMSPVASHVPAAVNVEENDGRVSRSRTVSNASQQGYVSLFSETISLHYLNGTTSQF